MLTLVVGASVMAEAGFTRDGQPAPVDGVPSWVSTDSTVVEVVPSADGMTATLKAVGPGDAQITATLATSTEGLLTAPAIDIHVDLPRADSVPLVSAVASPRANTEIEVRCANCGKIGTVPEATVGRKLRCKACQNVFVAQQPQERKQADDTAAPPSTPRGLGPHFLHEFVGQEKLKQVLAAKVREAKRLQQPLPHLMLCGPPDAGKATMAKCLPNELGTTIQIAKAATIKGLADTLPYLTNVTEGSVLLIEDIDTLPRVVCEFLESALEDYRVDIVLGEGANARTLSMPLKRFTAIGTTSKLSRVSKKLVRWFAVYDFKPYTAEEFSRWVWIMATNVGLRLTLESLPLLVNCCQGSHMHASALVKKIRNYMQGNMNESLTPVNSVN
jgi:Holliday junction resolvasome RuvABC ATP-dependent DNA helicase subunit